MSFTISQKHWTVETEATIFRPKPGKEPEIKSDEQTQPYK